MGCNYEWYIVSSVLEQAEVRHYSSQALPTDIHMLQHIRSY